MLLSTNILGALLALASAGLWGGGDFSGGVAARRLHPFQALALASGSGSVILLACLLAAGEGPMSLRGSLWALGAGAAGALGSAALYRALAVGQAATVAPIAAVIGAALPVCFGIVAQGWPGPARLAGFGVALAGIWLVSQAPGSDSAPGGRRPAAGLGMAVLSGLGFGGFFVFLAQTDHGALFMPVLLVRGTVLVISAALSGLMLCRGAAPAFRAHPGALVAGLLAGVADATGNVAYMLARQFTRLDVATVLGSLYPATTVLLAAVMFKERVSARQWLGVALCLAAIGLITV